ncbi:MAG TPA: hypothetical protein VJ898_02635 [Natrialbaceae archaeon]|nr:hypothetical protein [Natrialbaceae archaeon]
MTGGGISVRWNGTRYRGRAIDLDGDVDPEAVVESVAGDGPIDVCCPSPGPVHEHVGFVSESCSIRLRSALAAAARSRGLTAPMDDEVAAVDRRLSGIETTDDPTTEIADAQRRVTSARERERTLRERVQTLHGRLRGLRERDEPVENTEAALAAATEALAEVETERIAAEEKLQQHRQRAREYRDRRERRLRLQDKRDNLERAARRYLAEAVYDDFAAAVASVPGDAQAGDAPGEYEGGSTTAALAVARLADVRAPLVVSCGRFRNADRAVNCLGAPVIRIAREPEGADSISRPLERPP